MSANSSDLRVTQLIIYPVKGLAGQPCENVDVLKRGLAWDRRWMLVDHHHQFLSQRQIPRLVTIQARVVGAELGLIHRPTGAQLFLPIEQPDTASKIQVTIWKDQVEAVVVPDAAEWFSDLLHHGCQLVFMPESTRRSINPVFARPGEIVSFADAYPVLLIGEASLSELNTRLNDPVPIDRFRPNIVVSAGEPFAEDQWGELEIGTAKLRGVKASDRCSVPTIDQVSGEPVGPEPIRTLSQFRRIGKNVYFGQNTAVTHPGRITLNDRVIVKGRIAAVYPQ